MVPRGRLSIPYKILFKTIFRSFWSKQNESIKPNQRYGNALFCLSARTGLDLSLRTIKLPPGSEILAANINIPDMFTIIRAHDLVIQPVYIDRETLNLPIQTLENLITATTKAILATHLFGGIANMDEIIAFAKRNNLLVIEDCAQAFNYDYQGHEKSDIVLFSFGLIKTNTCLTGAMVRFANETFYQEVVRLNELLPQQKTKQYRLKLIKALVIKIMTSRYGYGLIYHFSKWMGKDFDDVLASFTKGFPGAAVMQKIKFRPCNSNLRLLKQRTELLDLNSIGERRKLAEAILKKIPYENQVGALNLNHSHWVLPIETKNTAKLIMALRAKGIDATSRASSLISLQTGRKTNTGQLTLDQLVYLPIDKALLEITWEDLL